MTQRATSSNAGAGADDCRLVAAAGLFGGLGMFAPDVIPGVAPWEHDDASSVRAILERLISALDCPSPDFRPYVQRIIQVAEAWASGHEKAPSDLGSDVARGADKERPRRIPLLSVLGRVQLDGAPLRHGCDWRYKLRPHGLGDDIPLEDYFPQQKNAYPDKTAKEDAVRLWEAFSAALEAGKGAAPLHPVDDVETLFEICRKFHWCVSAFTQQGEMPDVSLYEYAKDTAAIASCLHQYHAPAGTTADFDSLQDKEPRKFLLFCADIAGIQGFIYRISSKGAYKLLKGRSFYVQLLSEVIARHVVRSLGLTVANILYAGGGKCYLLLPNTDAVREGLDRIFSTLNVELFQQFNGDLHVRHGFLEISGANLCREKGHRGLDALWDDLVGELAVRDRQRFAELPPEDVYATIFSVQDGEEFGTCEVCHATTDKAQGNRCQVCDSLTEFGRMLGVAGFILAGDEGSALPGHAPVLVLPLGYRVWCLEHRPAGLAQDALVLWSVNSDAFIDLAKEERIRRHTACAPLMLGGNHKFNKEFDEIAMMSKGIRRLGVMRMDVDNLGLIFGKGLKNYGHGQVTDGRFHSLARITTLSWQLRLFFEGVLPRIVADLVRGEAVGGDAGEQRVTVVYSGGDDLFLLGAWDALPELALTIREKFSEFCCRNPSFSLSGGCVLTGGSFPVYKSAEMAGDAESEAKQRETRFTGERNSVRKSAFTFMETPMHWDEFAEIKKRKDSLLPVLDDMANRPLLRRLRHIALSWRESREAESRRAPGKKLEQIAREIQAERWRWRMVYTLARFAARNNGLKPLLDDLQLFIVNNVGHSQRSGIELLHVLVRWLEYFYRNDKGESDAAL